jgi:hypothetical protein
MWLAYVRERPAYNLKTAVENLAQNFFNLQCDAENEANNGFDRFYCYEECMALAERYGKAEQSCNKFLQTSDLRTFLSNIREIGLEGFLDEVLKFSPKDLIREVLGDDV